MSETDTPSSDSDFCTTSAERLSAIRLSMIFMTKALSSVRGLCFGLEERVGMGW
jgi:hypothetical protein